MTASLGLHRGSGVGQVESPHARRCSPRIQTSPGSQTGLASGSGISSGSVRPSGDRNLEQIIQLVLAEAGEAEIEALIVQSAELELQQILIPAGIEGELVVGDDEALEAGFAPSVDAKDRDLAGWVRFGPVIFARRRIEQMAELLDLADARGGHALADDALADDDRPVHPEFARSMRRSRRSGPRYGSANCGHRGSASRRPKLGTGAFALIAAGMLSPGPGGKARSGRLRRS
jgi:hypothetical protein